MHIYNEKTAAEYCQAWANASPRRRLRYLVIAREGLMWGHETARPAVRVLDAAIREAACAVLGCTVDSCCPTGELLRDIYNGL